MTAKVTIKKVDTSRLKRRFAGMIDRSNDFKPVFRWVFLELSEAHARQFASEGSASGFPWKPLDPQYSSWKLKNYGDNGILVRKGDLRDSLADLNSTRGAVRDIDAKKATFGTEVEYAHYHWTGTRKMPARRPLFVPRMLSDRTAFMVGRYIVDGQDGLTAAIPLAKVRS